MNKNICCLFDMDGVILDTETQYDVFWKHAGDKYNSGIENFEKVIKGTTLDGILNKYFTHLTQDEINSLVESLDEFEANMNFAEIEGAFAFIDSLKAQDIKIGLVTSSNDAKMIEVNKAVHLDKVFDTVVTGSDITKGKPNPECYLLAAKKLNVNPANCIVFEDSFAGLEAGNAAGMKTIGLATTHTADKLEGKCEMIINNFTNHKLEDFI